MFKRRLQNGPFLQTKTNKDHLRTLKLLPLSKYLVLNDLLLFIDIINNKFDYQILVHGNEQSFSRQGAIGEFLIAKNRITKTNNEYFRRTKTL